jgi:hypothetical protein
VLLRGKNHTLLGKDACCTDKRHFLHKTTPTVEATPNHWHKFGRRCPHVRSSQRKAFPPPCEPMRVSFNPTAARPEETTIGAALGVEKLPRNHRKGPAALQTPCPAPRSPPRSNKNPPARCAGRKTVLCARILQQERVF